MFRALMKTQNDVGMLLVRLGVGVSLLSHGLGKLGVFDDSPNAPGLFDAAEGSAQNLAAMIGSPDLVFLGWLAIAAEVIGAAALILGFFGRFCALCIGGVMVMAAWKFGSNGADALSTGEYVLWWRSNTGGYHLIMVLCCLAILIKGSGAASVDKALSSN